MSCTTLGWPDVAGPRQLGRASAAIGGTGSLTVNVARRGGFSGAITIQVTGLPVGVTAPTLTIPAGQNSGNVTFSAASTAARTSSPASASITGSGSGVMSVTVFAQVSVT